TISCLGCYQDGALAELICLPVEKLHPIPINMPLRLGALGEPGSIAMQAVKRGTPVDGETALVLGCGPIGLLATLFLTDHGVNVVAADLDEHRMMLARKFGAVATISAGVDPFPSPEDTKVLAEACQMAGPTLVIEATGVPVSLANAVRLAAPTARVVQVGISDTTAALSLRDSPFKELDIRGSRNSLNLIPEALEMLAKHQDLAAELITHDFEFAQLPKAFETMGDRNDQVGKIVIDLPAANAPDSTAQLQEVHPARPPTLLSPQPTNLMRTTMPSLWDPAHPDSPLQYVPQPMGDAYWWLKRPPNSEEHRLRAAVSCGRQPITWGRKPGMPSAQKTASSI